METEIVDLTGAVPGQTADYYAVVPGTNKRTGWVITFAGPGHPKSVAASNEASRKELLKSAKIEQARVNGRKFKSDDVQPEESRRDFVESVVARIVTWSPVKLGADTFPFSDKVAVDLLMRPEMGPYISQFTDFLLNEESFMPGSASA